MELIDFTGYEQNQRMYGGTAGISLKTGTGFMNLTK